MAIGKKNDKQPKITVDDIIEQRLEKLEKVVYKFLEDLARLLAGHDVTMDYMEPVLAANLRQSVLPFLSTGDRMKPNYGDHVKVVVEADMDNLSNPITAQVNFTDLSAREAESGARVKTEPRLMVLTITTDSEVQKVINYHLELAR